MNALERQDRIDLVRVRATVLASSLDWYVGLWRLFRSRWRQSALDVPGFHARQHERISWDARLLREACEPLA